jgi:EPS-associated MarR family transcriptional regulator
MDGHKLKILQELAKDNTLSQRDLSRKLGLSLGKVNYVLNALIDKGHVKAESFKNSKRKLAYMYILTPAGIKAKVELSYRFLKRKIDEYNTLKIEIEELRKETKLLED